MITRLPFVLGAALALSILAALFIGTLKHAPRPQLIAKPLPAPEIPIVPHTVRTIPITQSPPPPTRNYRAPEETVAAPLPPPPQKKASKLREKTERDICRGKGKRYTNNGRSWRCKR